MKAYADNPGPGQAIGLAFLIFAGCCVMVFALYLAGRVVLSAATVIGAALKLIPGVVVAIAPAMRGQFWRTLANVAMALLQLVFAIVLLYGYLLVVRALFAADEANLIRTVVFVDVFLIAGLLLFRRAMRGLQKMSDNLAAALSKRPGAAPTAITRSAPRTAADVAYMLHSGRQLYRGGRTVAKGAATLGRVGGHTAAGAVTGGVTAAVTAARATVKVAKTAKSKWDSRTEPHGNNTSDSEVVDRSETASERLSRTVLADKAGIKHPTGVAPAARTAARLGMTPRTPPRTVSREGQTFREFLTSAGAPLMVPVTEHRHRPITTSRAASAWSRALHGSGARDSVGATSTGRTSTGGRCFVGAVGSCCRVERRQTRSRPCRRAQRQRHIWAVWNRAGPVSLGTRGRRRCTRAGPRRQTGWRPVDVVAMVVARVGRARSRCGAGRPDGAGHDPAQSRRQLRLQLSADLPLLVDPGCPGWPQRDRVSTRCGRAPTP